MNRIDFYTNLAKFKKKDDELKHAAQYGYYNKIDKYYPDGTARYFYTKAEWDAYQDGINQENYKNEQAKKKIAEDRNDMSGYASWKKKEDEKKRVEKQTQQQINNNAEASKHEGDRYIEKNKELNKAISGRESAIKKSQSANQNGGNKLTDKVGEKAKGIAAELYEHKDEIVKKANSILKLTGTETGDLLDKFTEYFPPELKNKFEKTLGEIKDYAGDLIEKINNIGDEQIANVNDLIDKLVAFADDKIDKYSKELSNMYEKFKDKINPIFKDENGNINWKLFLTLGVGASIIQYIITHPDECFELFSNAYDIGKKTFNFINDKTNGKFGQALSEVPKMIDRYWIYKNFEKKGYGTFHVTDQNGNKITFLDQAFNNYMNAMDGAGPATMITEGAQNFDPERMNIGIFGSRK